MTAPARPLPPRGRPVEGRPRTGAIAAPEDGKVKRNVFSGKAQAWVELRSDRRVLSLMPNSIAPANGDGTATVEEFSGDLGAARSP